MDRAGNQTHAGQWAADRQANAAAQRDRSLDPYAEDRMEALSAQVVTEFELITRTSPELACIPTTSMHWGSPEGL